MRQSDVIGVEADRTAVIRDGRTIWIGSWFDALGGWLLSGAIACGDAGIATIAP